MWGYKNTQEYGSIREKRLAREMCYEMSDGKYGLRVTES